MFDVADLRKFIMHAAKERQVRNSLIYLLPPVLAAALPILTLPLFTRMLSKEDFGAYALAQVYGVFLTGLANMGLTTAYERNFFEYRESFESQAKLLFGVLLCVLAVFSVSILITWFCREQLAAWIIGDARQGPLLFWTACSLCVLSFKQFFLLYFRNIEDASSYARYSVDEMILNTLFSILLLYWLHSGVIGLAIGPLLGSLTVFIFLTARFLRRLTPALSWPPIKNSLLLALPLTPLTLFKVLGTQADKYLIGLLGSIGGVGLYSIGQRFGYLVFTWMTALQNVFSPQVYHRMFTLSPEEGGKSIGAYLTPFLYLSIGGALLVALFVQDAIVLLTPAAFHDACDAATVLALFYILSFFGKIPQLTYARKTHLTTVLSLGSNILNFLFCVVGIRFFGMMGAAWGLLASALVTVPIVYFLSQRSYFIQWEKRRVAAMFGYLFTSALCVIYLRSVGFGVLALVVLKTALIAGYIGIGVKIGLISRENVILSLNALRFRSENRAMK